MKKRIAKLFSAVFVATLLLLSSLEIKAETVYHYVQRNDYCSDYYPGCDRVVIKCDYVGDVICFVSDQVPCEEACEEDQQ